jgi:hypothetical protein
VRIRLKIEAGFPLCCVVLPGQEVVMKTLLLLLAASGLAGCATYQTPDYDSGAGPAYAQQPAPFIYDRAGYPSGYYPIPYAFPYFFARRPLHFHHGFHRGFHHGFHHGAVAGSAPHPGQRGQLAGALRPPHANKQ